MRKFIAAAIFMFAALVCSPSQAQEPAQTGVQRIERTLSLWKSEQGESVESEIEGLANKIGFKALKWRSEQEGEQTRISLKWQALDKQAGTLTWLIDSSGKIIAFSDPAFALGSKAFSLTHEGEHKTIQLEELNFITTPQGELGKLLIEGKCTIKSPVWLKSLTNADQISSGIWFATHADCAEPRGGIDSKLSSFYLHSALLSFVWNKNEGWKPTSFLATRIVQAKPGKWWSAKLSLESNLIGFGRETAIKLHKQDFRWQELVKVIELRRSTLTLPDTIDAMGAVSNAAMMVYCSVVSDNKITPATILHFLEKAGIEATTLSNNAIIAAEPTGAPD